MGACPLLVHVTKTIIESLNFDTETSVVNSLCTFQCSAGNNFNTPIMSVDKTCDQGLKRRDAILCRGRDSDFAHCTGCGW